MMGGMQFSVDNPIIQSICHTEDITVAQAGSAIPQYNLVVQINSAIYKYNSTVQSISTI